MKAIKQIIAIAGRECRIMLKNPIFVFCMLILPAVVVAFFTTLLDEGQPRDLPVGVVDQDNSSTSRQLSRILDSFSSSQVVSHYTNMNEARQAVQRGEIYAFILIPKGTEAGLMNSERPKISLYYSNVVLLAGSTTFKDLKTVAALGSAGVGAKKLAALGKTDREIQAAMQPINLDMHLINNPQSNYNVYLTTIMAPGLLMLFIFLITPYSIGTELKFGKARQWMYMADFNPNIALVGKMLPQTLIFLMMFYGYEFYIFHVLGFPHPGGVMPILLLGLVTVLSAQAFGMFVFGLVPSLRMSMTICSLWAMISFSLAGATYPVFSMDPFLEGVVWLFPLRHYYMIYQINIFNGFPLAYAWQDWACFSAFMILPAFVVNNIKKAMLLYKYIP
jgi:ABC-2 type transport system permease protein